MADKNFWQFARLPVEIQKDIFGLMLRAPRVHYLEMYTANPHQGWDDSSKAVKDIQGQTIRQDAGRVLQELVAGHGYLCGNNLVDSNHTPTDLAPPFKISEPQAFGGNPTSYYFTDTRRLKQVNQVACQTARSSARHPVMSQPPQIHRDLSGKLPTIPLHLNTKDDLVYLHNVMPGGFEMSETRKWLEDKETRASITDQTKNIQHIMFAFHGHSADRCCAGCDKLEIHNQQLGVLTRRRDHSRQERARRGDKIKTACKMCSKVQEQMKASSEPVEEATIREGLLKDRMLAMLPEVQRECVAKNHRIDAIINYDENRATYNMWSANDGDGSQDHTIFPATDTEDDDEDDTVSICSADIDPDDHFGWYNNSRNFLVVETIPYPQWGVISDTITGDTMPSDLVELLEPPSTHKPPPPPRTTGNTATDAFNLPTPLAPEHFHPPDDRAKPSEREPRHASHWQCRFNEVVTDIPPEVVTCFPDVVCVHIIDHDLTLRPDITELPAQGQRWLTGSQDTLFVEVVDPEDGSWVSEAALRRERRAAARRNGEPEPDPDPEPQRVTDPGHAVWDWDREEIVEKHPEDERPDPPGVLEYATWLKAALEKLFSGDEQKGVPARKVDVGIVAYVVLDSKGKVTYEGREKKWNTRRKSRMFTIPQWCFPSST
ncbi:uncharacterized protein B0H64DRAFT_464358 [Chaetomium fimeti]|uniref:Uncharacterized protein n=1 Tax=Chaetomium fimeti TaxID=1854472 RepID=A0AAE0LRF7_9PEZI|nr:hypothetical protein B0H64DRAFT_464358 [Chaetomium fimeti]